MIYVKYWECFSLNSIGCVTKCGPCWHSGGKYNRQMYVRPTCSNLPYRKIWSNILTARWRASAWSDKMNKEQSADDPSVDLIRVKNMLNSTISMSYPDVVSACIEHKVSLETFWWWKAALVSTIIIIWRIIPWWLTDHHNCCVPSSIITAEPTHSLSLSGKSGKTLPANCNALVSKWIYNIVLFGGKNGDCSFFIF